MPSCQQDAVASFSDADQSPSGRLVRLADQVEGDRLLRRGVFLEKLEVMLGGSPFVGLAHHEPDPFLSDDAAGRFFQNGECLRVGKSDQAECIGALEFICSYNDNILCCKKV